MFAELKWLQLTKEMNSYLKKLKTDDLIIQMQKKKIQNENLLF